MPLAIAALLAALLVACVLGSSRLELRVSNQSDAEAVVTISEPGTGVETMYSERVAAGEDRTIRIEYPGPEDWTLFVNDDHVTNAAMWPSDNPTLDFSITIRPDGTVELVDD